MTKDEQIAELKAIIEKLLALEEERQKAELPLLRRLTRVLPKEASS